MQLTLTKWGNSLGFRIPASVVKALALKSGDSVQYEIRGDEMIIKKEVTTEQLFEEFYGKSISELTEQDLGMAEEINWGEDVGGERF